MKRSRLTPKSFSRLSLESLDERVVPSRSWFAGLGIDVAALKAQFAIWQDRFDNDGDVDKYEDRKGSSGKNEGKDNGKSGKSETKALKASLLETVTVSANTNTSANSVLSVMPTVLVYTQSHSVSNSNAGSASDYTSDKSSTKTTVALVKPVVRPVEIKPIRDIDLEKIDPIREKIDDPDPGNNIPPVRPPIMLPAPERAADVVPLLRPTLDPGIDIVPAANDVAAKADADSPDKGAMGVDSPAGAVFVIFGSAPSAVAGAALPMIVGAEEAVEVIAPAVVQAAGAMASFVPFDPNSLQESVQDFIDSLRTKNLDEGSSFSFRQIALWTTGLLGGVITGELLRRKKLVKRSRQWLSMSLSKWLTLPIKD